MRKFLAPALAAVTAVGAVGFSTSASAQVFNPFGRSGTDAGTIASVIGLAIGVLGAGQNRSYSPYSAQYPYGGSQYPQYPQYPQAPYGAQYPYGQSPYGQSPYGYSPYGQSPYQTSPYGYGCRTQQVWDSYSRRYVTRQVC